jgi:hypothetical protein
MKNKIKGNKTKNHETALYPDLHIRFSNQVQNKTYIIFTMKMRTMVGLSQIPSPIQCLVFSLNAWKNITKIAKEDKSKYNNAGVQTLRSPTIGNFIIKYIYIYNIFSTRCTGKLNTRMTVICRCTIRNIGRIRSIII